MKRLGLVLCALALLASSCGVGVRHPASLVSETTAVMNGSVVSTAGGAGSYEFRYGPTTAPLIRTASKPIDFDANTSHPVSEPIDGLEPGTTYYYYVCAEDGENPGDKLCSRPQSFKTSGTGVPTLITHGVCDTPDDFSQRGVVVNFEPDTTYGVEIEFLAGGAGTGRSAFTTNADGAAGVGSVGIGEPFRLGIRIWVNPDGDFVQDPGEETVLDEVRSADEPCTDAQPEEPSNS